jgi:hypothetical protein
MYFVVLLTLAIALAAPAQAEQSYVWDGSSLRPVQTTQGLTCSNWAIWYFKRGVSQTPGSQWGAAIEQSAEGVLKDRRESLRLEEAGNVINAKFHLKGPDQHSYENYLGPICVTKTAFDAKPGAILAIENVGQLAGRISTLIRLVRTILNATSTAPTSGYQGYYLQEGSKTQLEQYLDNVQAISVHVHQLQNALMQRLGPAMMQINGGIDTVTAQLGQAEAGLPAIQKLVSAPAATVSAAWISKTQDFGGGEKVAFQEVSGGISMKSVRVLPVINTPLTTVQNIQFNNIDHVDLQQDSVVVTLKAPIAGEHGGDTYTTLRFTSPQDAQDASNFLKAQIR